METVETIDLIRGLAHTSLKRGVNEISKAMTVQHIDRGLKIKFTHALLALDDNIS